MNNLKVRKSGLMLSVIILSLLITPFLATKGETYQLIYSDFYIEPSKPEVIAEMDFTLNNLNDYVFGLPQASGVGTFTTSRTYFFEIWTEDNKRGPSITAFRVVDSGSNPGRGTTLYPETFFV